MEGKTREGERERKRPEGTVRMRGMTSGFFGGRDREEIVGQPPEKRGREQKVSVLTKWDKILDFRTASEKKKEKK